MLLAGSLASARADLGAAASYSAAHGERALLVCHRGKIVFERGPALVQTPRIYSITKSLFSIGAFRDARKGGISLERPVSRGPARGVKLAELMNPPRRSRGFVYGAAHWEVLGEEISLASGTTLESWIMKHVPGAHAGILARWRRDGKGRMFLSTGARMSARELLPAGREVLAGLGRGFGRWPAAVRGLLSTGTPQNGMYALGFWLNRSAGTAKAREIVVEDSLDPPPNAGFWRDGCLSRHAPADLLAMIGSGGQRVYVVPSRQLVVIRLASGGSFSDAEFLGRYFAPAHTAQAGRTPRG